MHNNEPYEGHPPVRARLKHSVFLFLFLLCLLHRSDEKARICVPHPERSRCDLSRTRRGEGGHLLFRLVLVHFSSHCSASRARSRPRNAAIRHRRTRARAKRDFNATQTAPLSFRFFFFFLFPSPRHSRTVSAFGATRTPTSRGLLIFRIRLRSRGQRRDACFAIVTENSLCVGWLISFACPPLLYLH